MFKGSSIGSSIGGAKGGSIYSAISGAMSSAIGGAMLDLTIPEKVKLVMIVRNIKISYRAWNVHLHITGSPVSVGNVKS